MGKDKEREEGRAKEGIRKGKGDIGEGEDKKEMLYNKGNGERNEEKNGLVK